MTKWPPAVVSCFGNRDSPNLVSGNGDSSHFCGWMSWTVCPASGPCSRHLQVRGDPLSQNQIRGRRRASQSSLKLQPLFSVIQGLEDRGLYSVYIKQVSVFGAGHHRG